MSTDRTHQSFVRATAVLAVLLPLLLLGTLFIGSVHIPVKAVLQILAGHDAGPSAWNHIVLSYRLPQAVTAAMAGAALAASGLMMQTLFRNALADPSILGISSGASLGAAVVMLFFGGAAGSIFSLSIPGSLLVITGAFAGSMAVMALIVWFAAKVRSNVMLLIIGIMIGYLASSVIYVLNFHASMENIRQFVFWSMGDFSGMTTGRLPFFCTVTAMGLAAASLLVKPLNALLLGDNYAANLGVRLRPVRIAALTVTGLLTSTVTAFCGPVAFIGLAVPHIVRMTTGCSNHRQLMPLTLLAGAVISLVCNLCTLLPSDGSILPLNTITPLIGAPVVLLVILRRRHI